VRDRPKAGCGRSRQQTTREGAPPCPGQCSASLSGSRRPWTIDKSSAVFNNAMKDPSKD
jgi:hypothetical protein